jgi:hypothetical protein
MLLSMSSLPDRTPDQKRRSFLILVLVLVVAAAAVAFAFSRGGDDGSAASPSSPGGSSSSDVVDLQAACAEIPPDQAFRVDALRRTADRVRAVIAEMQAQGNDADAAQATTVVEALERLADAEENQQGVSRATRELGETLVAVC